MAYYDQRTGTSERAIAATIVTALQVGVIVALVQGLAVVFNPPDEPQRVIGEQIPLTPPPVPDVLAEPSDTPIVTSKTGDVSDKTASDTTDIIIFNDGQGAEKASGADETAAGGTQYPPLPPANLARFATPTNSPGGWVTQNDYSASDIRAERQGTARFTLGIGTDGKVQSCTIVTSTGFASLDAATCKHVSRRARFERALDDAGAPITGSYTGSIRWVIPE
jgi:periplasmic protein TonB